MPDPDSAATRAARTTLDAFLGGRLVLEQPAKGHRSGTDAVLLAATVPRDFEGLVFDIGAGVGAVGLSIALACEKASVVLVEKDADSVSLAARNVLSNRLTTRVKVAQCDLFSRAAREKKLPRKADLIVTNPPFHRAGRVRPSQDLQRRAAHVLEEGFDLEDWLSMCVGLLAAKGSLIVLHQAEAVPAILDALSNRLGDLRLMAIHPRAGQPAVRVLLRGRQGSRAPLRIEPPLVLHDGDRFTPESAVLHEGKARIVW